MKKLLIPFIASFGLSLGIATGVVVVRTPKAVAAAKPGQVVAPTQKRDSTGIARDSVALPPADSTGAASALAAGQTASANTTGAPGDGASVAAGVTAASQGAHAVPAPDKATKSEPAASATRGPNAKLASTASAAPRSLVPVVKPATDSLIGRRLAQVFGAMQPKDAARVLEQMDDNDVRAILGSLSSKQQAAILGSFPTQRAALILQATLRTASNGGTE
jgi:hypothetical protein